MSPISYRCRSVQQWESRPKTWANQASSLAQRHWRVQTRELEPSQLCTSHHWIDRGPLWAESKYSIAMCQWHPVFSSLHRLPPVCWVQWVDRHWVGRQVGKWYQEIERVDPRWRLIDLSAQDKQNLSQGQCVFWSGILIGHTGQRDVIIQGTRNESHHEDCSKSKQWHGERKRRRRGRKRRKREEGKREGEIWRQTCTSYTSEAECQHRLYLDTWVLSHTSIFQEKVFDLFILSLSIPYTWENLKYLMHSVRRSAFHFPI